MNLPLLVLVCAFEHCGACAAAMGLSPWQEQGSAEATRPTNEPTQEQVDEDDLDAALTDAKLLLEEAQQARRDEDLETARAKVAEAIAILLEEEDDRKSRVTVLDRLGRFADETGDLRSAERAWRRVLEVRSRTLPDEHPDLQTTRRSLADTIYELGDLQGARRLEEKVLEVCSRTLPDNHPDLASARHSLAVTMKGLGDLPGARALYDKALEVFSRTLPDDHPGLAKMRYNLAVTMWGLGDLPEARALFDKALEVFSRTLPDDHPDLQAVRCNLANTIRELGDLQGARVLQEQVLEVRSRTLPDDHPDLQAARGNLANTIQELGDLQGARVLFEKVLEVRSRILPDDHPKLQWARGSLAAMNYLLGDLQGARALQEQVLEVLSRTLPDDHPNLQAARGNLALTIQALGDLPGARALEEKVLEVRSRTLPDEHPDLQTARGNLAITIAAEIARSESARAREEERDQVAAGRKRLAQILESYDRGLRHFALTAILDGSFREAEERVSSLDSDLGRVLSLAAGLGVLGSDPAAEGNAFLLSETMRSVAFASARVARSARGEAEYAELCSRRRAASDALAALSQSGFNADEFGRARARLDEAERELVRRGAAFAPGLSRLLEPSLEALAAAIEENEALIAFRRFSSRKLERGDPPTGSSTKSLCAFVLRPEPGGAPVLARIELGPIAAIEDAVQSWRRAIGANLERGVEAFDATDASGLVQKGDELRALILDPLAPALAGVNRIVVALDDVLHAVPLDALPAGGPWVGENSPVEDREATKLRERIGDRFRVEVRNSLLELLIKDDTLSGGGLLALGHPAFDLEPVPRSADLEEMKDLLEGSVARASEDSGILRGSAWERGFTTLPGTRDEVRAIADYFHDTFEGIANAVVLERDKASRENLIELAPKARFLHVATHGWFAPESIRSFEDMEPLDAKSGLIERMGGEERVRGMSPMLLCGVALAGANLKVNALGKIPGLVTAEELAALDLSNCELAVISACDTNVGVRRAGQGVASLQRALHMAGACTVITSLWKVPDQATQSLMTDFYRRIWVEKKPKAQALWEAKTRLRNAKDESGNPLYTDRDWAAWVLTGDPR